MMKAIRILRTTHQGIVKSSVGVSRTNASHQRIQEAVSFQAKSSLKGPSRFFSTTISAESLPSLVRPTRINAEERAALRAARRERGRRVLQQQQQQQQQPSQIDGKLSSATTATSTTSSARPNIFMTRWMWYLGVAVPTGLIVWAVRDPDSPPAKLSEMIGLTRLIKGFADEIAKPTYDKLLPDWSQMPNVPHDIPIPHTLVLDLENTLVCSTWDRKHGWRHAKRPGVDKFLRTMAQYYEIVLYSPSIEGVADPVVHSMDKEGCIMHRLYRDATHYVDGVHVKDLDRLNRDVRKIIVVDDDPAEVQFHPYNVLRVKPYTDPTDRTDNMLERITPFLLEIVREGYNDIPAIMKQYQGMDADEIMNEQERRINQVRMDRERLSKRGLSGLVGGAGGRALPAPELPPMDIMSSASFPQLTAKDIAGAMPANFADDGGGGLVGWMNRMNKEKEEHRMRKMEKWNEVLLEKQRKRREAGKQ